MRRTWRASFRGDPGLKFGELTFPAPFVLDDPEGVLVIPQNAGLLFRVDELEWDGKTLGGFMSMPWFGETDLASGQGYICIFATPDDVMYKGRKVRGAERDVLSAQPCFQPQKGTFGYTRRLLYHFADRGGHVALAKRYRAYAKTRGLVKTLEEKRRERPSIDRLVGAVNIYCDHFQNVEELRKLGIERAMVSGFSKDNVRKINDLGYLSSHYDIYTDLYESGTPPGKWERCEGFDFPRDVIKKTDGSNQIGWCPFTDKKTGIKYPSYVICWTCGLRTLKEKMPKRLAESPFSAYFLDCVTATGLYECYDPAHPLTRTTDREARVGQLDYLTRGLGLVAGSEQGRDWAVPVADYFEGVMSTTAFFANPKEIHAMPFETLSSDPSFSRSRSTDSIPGAGCRCSNWCTATAARRRGAGATTVIECHISGGRRICWRWFTRRCRPGCCGSRSRSCLKTRRRGSKRVMTMCAAGGARSATRKWSTTSGLRKTGWCSAARLRTERR